MKNKIITLATLPEATAQEVFDQVARHLLTQKAKALDGNLCVYLADDGLKCAAGCLIDSKEINKISGGDWAALVISEQVPKNHMDLICKLQSIHDDFNPDRWRGKLEILSNELWLNFPSL